MVPSSGCRHYMYMLNGRVYLGCITAGSSSIQVYYIKGTVSYPVLYRVLCREGLMIGNRGWWLTIYRMLYSYMSLGSTLGMVG